MSDEKEDLLRALLDGLFDFGMIYDLSTVVGRRGLAEKLLKYIKKFVLDKYKLEKRRDE